MAGSARLQVDSSHPALLQRARGRIHHARQGLDRIEFAQRGYGQCRLQRQTKTVRVDRTDKAARQARCCLVECHHLHPMLASASRLQAPCAQGQSIGHDQGAPGKESHGHPSGE